MTKLNRRKAASSEYDVIIKVKLHRKRVVDQGSSNHWDRIFFHSEYCIVCDKKLGNKKKVFIAEKEGIKLYRHDSCNALSAKWKKKFHGCTTLTANNQQQEQEEVI